MVVVNVGSEVNEIYLLFIPITCAVCYVILWLLYLLELVGEINGTILYIAGLILGFRLGNKRYLNKGGANLEWALHNEVSSLLLSPIDLVSIDALLYFYDNKHILILFLNYDSYKLVTGVLWLQLLVLCWLTSKHMGICWSTQGRGTRISSLSTCNIWPRKLHMDFPLNWLDFCGYIPRSWPLGSIYAAVIDDGWQSNGFKYIYFSGGERIHPTATYPT